MKHSIFVGYTLNKLDSIISISVLLFLEEVNKNYEITLFKENLWHHLVISITKLNNQQNMQIRLRL